MVAQFSVRRRSAIMKQAVDFFKVIYIDSNPGNGGKMPERNVNIK